MKRHVLLKNITHLFAHEYNSVSLWVRWLHSEVDAVTIELLIFSPRMKAWINGVVFLLTINLFRDWNIFSIREIFTSSGIFFMSLIYFIIEIYHTGASPSWVLIGLINPNTYIYCKPCTNSSGHIHSATSLQERKQNITGYQALKSARYWHKTSSDALTHKHIHTYTISECLLHSSYQSNIKIRRQSHYIVRSSLPQSHDQTGC